MRYRSRLWLTVLLLLLTQAACVKIFRLPRPHPTTPPPVATGADDKELAKKKRAYLDGDMEDAEKCLSKLHRQLHRKRAKGYNTDEGEAVLGNIAKAIREAKDLVYWASSAQDLEAVALKIQEIKTLEDKARDSIEHAPLFGDKPKEEKVQRKYSDQRDWVREATQTDPGQINKQTRGLFALDLQLFDATPIIQRTSCWNAQTNTFRLETPPQVEVWTFPKLGRKVVVFAETNFVIDQFRNREYVGPSERDQLLAQLCGAQIYSGGYRVIYFGDPVTDAHTILEQLLTGRGRVAGMFGLQAIERIMKITAVLPDLAVASITFSTALHPLNQLQQEQFTKFMKDVAEYDPELMGILTIVEYIREESDFANVKKKLLENPWKTPSADAKKRQDAVLHLLDDGARLIEKKGDPEKVKNGIIGDLWKLQTPETKKRRDTVQKIFKWQRTLHPARQDIKELAKRFPALEATTLKVDLETFANALEKLAEEFGVIQKNLRKYRTEYTETLFKEGQTIAVFFLVDGVRFAEHALPGGQTVDSPDLALKITVEIRKGKKEPPTFLKDFDVKITTANQYIDEVRELRRLASFGIKFPASLPKGSYAITFIVTDNLRAQSATASAQWFVIAPEPEAKK